MYKHSIDRQVAVEKYCGRSSSGRKGLSCQLTEERVGLLNDLDFNWRHPGVFVVVPRDDVAVPASASADDGVGDVVATNLPAASTAPAAAAASVEG